MGGYVLWCAHDVLDRPEDRVPEIYTERTWDAASTRAADQTERVCRASPQGQLFAFFFGGRHMRTRVSARFPTLN